MRRWRRVGIIVIVWAVGAAALEGADAEPQVVVLGGLVAVIVASVVAALDLFREATPVEWARAPRPIGVQLDDEAVLGLVRDVRSARRSSSNLRSTLLTLIDERLLDHHGVDRLHDPAAARAILGPGLITFIEQPDRRLADPADLDRLLDEIEAV